MKNNRILPRLVLAIISLSFSGAHLPSCSAAPGDLDTSFGKTGTVKTGFGGGRAISFASAVQSDGKLILAGFGNPRGSLLGGPGGDFLLARFETNNTLDHSFGNEGIVITRVSTNIQSIFSSEIKAVLIQPDGKIVAGGYSFPNTNYTDFTLVRYNPDGSLDTSFGTNGTGIVYTDFGQNSQINGLAFQFGTNLIAAGSLLTNNDATAFAFALACYDANGAPVPSFGTGGTTLTAGSNYSANAVITEGDGSILAAGAGTAIGDTNSDFALFHYTTNGLLDATFTGGGKVFTRIGANDFSDKAAAVALQAGNITPPIAQKIVVAGTYENSAFQTFQTVIRYNLDGSVDTSFGTNGIATNMMILHSGGAQESCTSLIVQGQLIQPRKITIGGWGFNNATNFYFTLARLTSAGVLDTTFGTNSSGKIAFNVVNEIIPIDQQAEANAMVLQSGNFVLSGVLGSISIYGSGFAAARFNSSGLLDSTFGTNGLLVADVSDEPEAQANGVAIQQDGKIVVAGFSPFLLHPDQSLTREFALARYNTDGSLDTTFGQGGKVLTTIGSGDLARAVAIQADGKIVVGGSSFVFGVRNEPSLARYNADGSLDTSFGNNGSITEFVGDGGGGINSLKIQADGKILAAGFGIDLNSNSFFTLLRFNTNGALDLTFGNSGRVTTSFVGGNLESAYDVEIGTDGRIAAVGLTEQTNDTSLITMADITAARYHTNGALDFSFGSLGRTTANAGGGSLDIGYALAIQPDGKIVVAGAAGLGGLPGPVSFNLRVNSFIALVRFNTNGTLDTSFGEGGTVVTEVGPFSDFATSIAVQPNGKILIAGSSLDGTYEFFAMRYNSDGSVDSSYGDDGIAFVDFGSGADELPYALSLDSMGRAVLAGDGGGLFGVARLQGDVVPGPLLNIFLTATNTAVVSWPFPSTGFALQQNTDLINGSWSTPPQTVGNDGTNNFIIVSPPAGTGFYRLFEP